jgi:hypothetical protein
MKQESQHFWHDRSQNNQLLIETYCLLCFKFLGASELAFNLALVELAHRAICNPEIDDGNPAKK